MNTSDFKQSGMDMEKAFCYLIIEFRGYGEGATTRQVASVKVVCF